MSDPGTLRRSIDSLYESETITSDGGREFRLRIGVTREQGQAIRDLVFSCGAVRSLETGFGLGFSALWICDALLASGDPNATHVAMDPIQKERFDDVGLKIVRDAGVADMVRLHRQPSSLVLPRLVQEALDAGSRLEYGVGSVNAFDVAFIDGAHHFENAFLDIYYAFMLVRPEGLIIVDDEWMPAVRHAIAYFEANMGFERLPSPIDTPKRRRMLRRDDEGFIRMAVLRRPSAGLERDWDHFVPFA